LKKILFISYVFPPTGGAGIQRTVKLLKYTYRLGWEPFVLTTKNPSVPVFDNGMLKDIPTDVKIFKSITFEIPYSLKRKLWKETVEVNKTYGQNENVHKKSLLSIFKSLVKKLVHIVMMPDPQVGWNYTAYKTAKKIIEKYHIHYVFISAPPFSSLLLINKLSNLGVKVVADFRDEWTEFYLKSYDFHRRDEHTFIKIKNYEETVMNSASLITMATQSFVNNYKKTYPVHAKKIKVLTNGFDEDDFSELPSLKKDDQIFEISYTGTIFNVTTARYFLQSVESLLSNNLLNKELRLNFVGRITEDESIYFSNFKFQENLNCTGYVDHVKSIEYLAKTDMLLVIVDELEGSERIIAAKVFEYIRIGKPILALVPEKGEIAKIIHRTNSGTVVSNRNVEAIREALIEHINSGITYQQNEKEILKYSREEIAKQLIEYLEDLNK